MNDKVQFVQHDENTEYATIAKLSVKDLSVMIKMEASLATLMTVLKIYLEKSKEKSQEVVSMLSGLIDGLLDVKAKTYDEYLKPFDTTTQELEDNNMFMGYNTETFELGIIKNKEEIKNVE